MSNTATKKTFGHADRYGRRKQIAKAIKAGRSMSEVCQKFEVSSETVRRACIEHGVAQKQ